MQARSLDIAAFHKCIFHACMHAICMHAIIREIAINYTKQAYTCTFQGYISTCMQLIIAIDSYS